MLGYYDLVVLLVDYFKRFGLSIDQRDQYGYTPAILACIKGFNGSIVKDARP